MAMLTGLPPTLVAKELISAKGAPACSENKSSDTRPMVSRSSDIDGSLIRITELAQMGEVAPRAGEGKGATIRQDILFHRSPAIEIQRFEQFQ